LRYNEGNIAPGAQAGRRGGAGPVGGLLGGKDPTGRLGSSEALAATSVLTFCLSRPGAIAVGRVWDPSAERLRADRPAGRWPCVRLAAPATRPTPWPSGRHARSAPASRPG